MLSCVMTANAPPSAVNSPLTFSAKDTDLGLGKVEMRMCSLTDITHESFSVAHEAVRYHLESGGRLTRAVIGLEGGNALGIQQVDSVALAACAELLHNASLIHDDLQDRSLERRERVAVWSKFSEAIAICAGDLLVSAAYASLVAVTDKEKLGELVAAVHAATAVVIAGQARDLLLQNACLADFQVYRQIAGAKSGLRLGLPLELALIAADGAEDCLMARAAATDLAVAYQIADDIADEQADAVTASRAV